MLNKYTQFIKDTSKLLGFNYCGISKAEFLNEDARRLEEWLNKGLHGNMAYMENHFELRVDPTKLVPNAKSVITLMINYFPEKKQNIENPKISKYAYGKDYHEIIRKKLKDFFKIISTEIGEINGRGFVDSAPVLERTWAKKSGLGWIGKNGMLINKNSGSFYFIATLIVDVELEYNNEIVKDFCGTCNKCVEACPTEAILPNKVIDGSKCISYFTIELKEMMIPENMKNKFDNWMFGCDTCQDVCPWNRFSKKTNEIEFKAIPEIINFSIKDWNDLTEENFKIIFSKSPLKRSKFEGLKRNLKFIQQ